jgi:hypothetical protein
MMEEIQAGIVPPFGSAVEMCEACVVTFEACYKAAGIVLKRSK